MYSWGYEMGPPGWYYEDKLMLVNTAAFPLPTWTDAKTWVGTARRSVIGAGGEMFVVAGGRLTVMQTPGGTVLEGYTGYTAPNAIWDIDVEGGRLAIVDQGCLTVYAPFAAVPATVFLPALPFADHYDYFGGMFTSGNIVCQIGEDPPDAIGGSGSTTWEFWNVTNPYSPVQIGGVSCSYDAWSSCDFGVAGIWGRLAVIATGYAIQLQDLDRPGSPYCILPEAWSGSGTAAGVHVYLGVPGQLAIYDISDWTAPALRSRTPLAVDSSTMTAIGDQLYMLAGGQLYRMDVGDPSAPGPALLVPLSGPATSWAREGDLLYLASGSTVQIVDVSTPAAPLPLASHVLSRGQAPIAVHDGYIYATGGGIHVHSAHGSMALQYVGSTTEYSPGTIGWAGSRLYASAGGARAVLPQCYAPVGVGLEGLAAGVQGGSVRLSWRAAGSLAGAAWEVRGRLGDRAWLVPVIEEGDGTFVAHDRDPALAAGGRVLYTIGVREAGGDLTVLAEREVEVTTEVPATRLLAVAPNPFNPSCEVRFALRRPGPVRITVHDLAGRRVATLLDEPRAAGEHAVAWRGLDDGARRIGAGVYLLRLEADGKVESRKVSLIK